MQTVLKFERNAPVFALRDQSHDFIHWSNFDYLADRQDEDEFFLDVLSENFILLKNIRFYGSHLRGAIAVKNSSFEKEVFVRYSFDEWNRIHEKEAQFQLMPTRLKNGRFLFTNDPFDIFYFEIDLEEHLNNYCEIQFAFRYKVDGNTYWDNNDNDDYRLSFYVPFSAPCHISSSSSSSSSNLHPKKSILRNSSKPIDRLTHL